MFLSNLYTKSKSSTGYTFLYTLYNIVWSSNNTEVVGSFQIKVIVIVNGLQLIGQFFIKTY